MQTTINPEVMVLYQTLGQKASNKTNIDFMFLKLILKLLWKNNHTNFEIRE